METMIDRTRLAITDEHGIGHLNRRNLTRGDIARYLRRTGETELPQWDNWGYAMAYYIAEPARPSRIHPQWTGFVDGEIAVAQHTGDVLCGTCAAAGMFDPWELVTVAYQCNGEIGDEETVTCDHCGRAIYEPNA